MLNIAVIGAGRIGHVHAKTIAAHPGATLALVADPFGDAAQKLAEVYGARHTTDVDSVFTDEAARDELGAVSVPVMFGFNRRFDPSFAAVHAQLEEGKIGDLENLLIISRDPSAPPAEYVKVSGGIFRDMTIHDFDMARFFLGDIVEVHAFGQNFNEEIREAGDFDAAVVTLKPASSQPSSTTASARPATTSAWRPRARRAR